MAIENVTGSLQWSLFQESEYEKCGELDMRKLSALRDLFGFRRLEQEYLRVCNKLRSGAPLAEQRTEYERKFVCAFRRHTHLGIRQSFWIGRSCFDFFIPAVTGGTGSKMRGLAIEIDGPVHMIEHKMKKDEARREMLARLGICLMSIDNWDVNAELPRTFIETIRSFRRIDHRARQRLLSKIYALTILESEKFLPGGRHVEK